MIAYFFVNHRRLPEMLWGRWGRVLQEGAIAGLIGAGVVAVWFLVVDAFKAELFHTPILLGSRIFGDGQPEPVTVLLYTAAHGLAFLAFGIIAAGLINGAESQPLLILGLAILFTAFEVVFFGAIVIVAKWVLDELAGWAIFLGNVLAAAAMLWYFFSRHRSLATRLVGSWEDE
jgi:hypothetical protein